MNDNFVISDVVWAYSHIQFVQSRTNIPYLNFIFRKCILAYSNYKGNQNCLFLVNEKIHAKLMQ